MNKQTKMKLLIVVSLLFIFSVPYAVAQENLVTVNLEHVSLKEVLNAIEKQTTYRFSYRNVVVDMKRDVTISRVNASVTSVLDEILSEKKLDYTVISPKSIVVFEKQQVQTTKSNMRRISGVVNDEMGEPIIGANVSIKGTSIGSITDVNGNFNFEAPDNGILMISFIGYILQEIDIRGKDYVVITLKEDFQTLDEVVVIGYGTVKKSDVTGALTRVTEKAIKERPVQNALQAMQGKAAGVQISTNNRPGELGEIRIRGNRSINASNDPLYVIDGIPMTAGSLADINPNDIESIEVLKDASATAIYGSRGANGVILVSTKKGKTGKVTINYDGTVMLGKIHSLTDWMSAGEKIDWNRQAAINAGSYAGGYGNAPDPSIDSDSYFEVSQIPYMRPIFESAFQFNPDGTPVLRPATDYEKNVLKYADMVPVYDSSKIPTTPWTDYVTRIGITQNHQISLSAGTDKAKLYISMAYLDQQAALKDQDYKRYSVNMNGEITATKWLKVGMGLNASHSIQNYGIVKTTGSAAKDSYGLALNLEPYAPAYDEDGTILKVEAGPSQHNVLLNINEATNETRSYSILMNSYAEVNLFPWLRWRTNFGAQFRNSREGSYYGSYFTNPLNNSAFSPNVAYNQHNQRMAWTLENLIYIDKTFNDIHTLGLTLMQSAEHYRTESLDVRAYETKFPTALWYSVGDSDTSRSSIGSGFNQQQRASYMGRLNYNLMDKYLLTVTGRWDGASMLAKGNKWDFFPSMALAWKLNKEKFFSELNWLSELKFRLGYGVTGNASISSYQTGGTMESQYANIPFGQGGGTTSAVGAKAVVLPNRELAWEKTASTNIGLDFGLLNNRITGSLEYYVSKTSDLLLNRSIPMMTGYVSIISNVGKTQNKGFELTLSTVNINTKNFTWKTDFTFFTNSEKIIELADGRNDDPANGWFVGRAIDEVWTKKFDRLWQNTPEDKKLLAVYKANSITMFPGQAKIVDQPFIEVPQGTEGAITKKVNIDGIEQEVTYLDNGFGKIDNDDNHFLGSFRPKWEGGFTSTFIWKNWELNTFIYGRFGGLYYGLLQTYGSRIEKDVWSENNTSGKFPQPRSGGEAYTSYQDYQNYTKSDMIIVRNISLSYTLPEKKIKKLGISNCSVYAQVLNPFIFGGELVKAGINPDDVTGWKPSSVANGDYRYAGGQTNNTMLTRSLVFGLRLGF